MEVDFASGVVSSSDQPPFKYFPYRALVRIAARFTLGITRKKEKAWNALSKNQSCLTNMDFVLERCSHAAHHALKLAAILSGAEPDDGDDHAAAIGWSSMFLCAATDALAKANAKPNCSACGGTGEVREGVSNAITVCPACHGTKKANA